MPSNIKINEITIPTDYSRKLKVSSKNKMIDSIKKIGQLQPIAVDEDKVLIFGQHRLEAMRELNYNDISAIVVSYKHDSLEGMQMSLHENDIRHSFTKTEKLAMLERLKEKEDARSSNKGNQYTELVNVPIGTTPNLTKQENEKASNIKRKKQAVSVGFASHQEAARVKKTAVDGIPEVVKAMDDEVIAPSASAIIAKLPKEEQQEALDDKIKGKKIQKIDGSSNGREDVKIRLKKDNHGAYVEIKVYKNNPEKTAKNISGVFGEDFREAYIALLLELVIKSRGHNLIKNNNDFKTYSYGFTSMSDGEVKEVKELMEQNIRYADIIEMYNSNKETIGNIAKLTI